MQCVREYGERESEQSVDFDGFAIFFWSYGAIDVVIVEKNDSKTISFVWDLVSIGINSKQSLSTS